MDIVNKIKESVKSSLEQLYSVDVDKPGITVNETKPEFEGDYTVVLFSFVKSLKKSPEQLGKELGESLVKNNSSLFTSFNVIKGFLNLAIADSYWANFLQQNYINPNFGNKPANGKKVMVEYSSPNTNKPLHLGHLRNNFRMECGRNFKS